MRRVVEAILFTSPEPLPIRRIARIAGMKEEEVEKAVEELSERYISRNSAIEVIDIGGKYLMRVRPEYHAYVRRFAEKDIDRGTLRTLAVIALWQPIMLSKLAKIRGNKCYEHVRKLEELGLIKAGKKGRTKLLKTTKRFAVYFGLKSDNPEEIREFLRKATKEDSTLIRYINDLHEGNSS